MTVLLRTKFLFLNHDYFGRHGDDDRSPLAIVCDMAYLGPARARHPKVFFISLGMLNLDDDI